MNDTELVEGRHGCRAPVNGMIVGAITGAVLALAFLLPYFGSGADGRIYLVAPGVVAIYAVGGWLTGLWGKSSVHARTPGFERRRLGGSVPLPQPLSDRSRRVHMIFTGSPGPG